MQKVIINAVYGGNESGTVSENLIEKNFNLEISKKIYNNLKNLGLDVYLVRDDDKTLSNEERLEIINSYLNTDDDEVIVLSNMLSSGNDAGAEIIYALRNDDDLAREISNYIEEIGQDILKYYQLRDPNDTALDYYSIIGGVPNNVESIIVSYGYPSNSFDNRFLTNNIDTLAEAVSNAIYDYLKRVNIYIVQPGDSLYRIAEKFNTTVQAIKELNNLTSNNLFIGQELFIPKSTQTPKPDNNSDTNFFNYTVEFGDTLYSIARKYNTTVNVLKEINNLTSNNLSIGQILKIPTRITNEDTNNYIIYTVKAGDSLYKIAQNYGVSVDEIKNLNGLSNNLLSIGQMLKIPTQTNNNSEILTYIVKAGDSLYKIAILYGTTVDAIKELNNLTSNNLSIGQVLKIPNSSNTSYISYIVKAGDSLYKIANLYSTSVNAIKELNNLTSNNLSIGQVLKIPTS